jgi:hypothetical protein
LCPLSFPRLSQVPERHPWKAQKLSYHPQELALPVLALLVQAAVEAELVLLFYRNRQMLE